MPRFEDSSVEHGSCIVIPDYPNEIARLKEALTHKTKMCERIEKQKGCLTMEINKQKSELTQIHTSIESLHREKVGFISRIQDLQERVDMCKGITILKQMQEETQYTAEILKQTLEKSQHTAEILTSTLAEERASKRQRSEDGSHFVIQ